MEGRKKMIAFFDKLTFNKQSQNTNVYFNYLLKYNLIDFRLD